MASFYDAGTGEDVYIFIKSKESSGDGDSIVLGGTTGKGESITLRCSQAKTVGGELATVDMKDN